MKAVQLPKTLQRFADRIEDYSDERGSGNGIWIYYKRGYKSHSDPMGCLHQDHEDTVAKLASCARHALRCNCNYCRGLEN